MDSGLGWSMDVAWLRWLVDRRGLDWLDVVCWQGFLQTSCYWSLPVCFSNEMGEMAKKKKKNKKQIWGGWMATHISYPIWTEMKWKNTYLKGNGWDEIRLKKKKKRFERKEMRSDLKKEMKTTTSVISIIIISIITLSHYDIYTT